MIWLTATIPASAPDSVITIMIVREFEMPAYRAALALCPIALRPKPKRVCQMRRYTPIRQSTASTRVKLRSVLRNHGMNEPILGMRPSAAIIADSGARIPGGFRTLTTM